MCLQGVTEPAQQGDVGIRQRYGASTYWPEPAALRVRITGSREPCRWSVGTRTGRFMRRLNWMPSGRARERTIQRYGSIEQCAVDGTSIARRYTSIAASSEAGRGPDQSSINSPTSAASSATS